MVDLTFFVCLLFLTDFAYGIAGFNSGSGSKKKDIWVLLDMHVDSHNSLPDYKMPALLGTWFTIIIR